MIQLIPHSTKSVGGGGRIIQFTLSKVYCCNESGYQYGVIHTRIDVCTSLFEGNIDNDLHISTSNFMFKIHRNHHFSVHEDWVPI